MVAMKAKLTNGVISAAKASLVSFNNHIAVNERCYEFRRRYHISTKPEGPNTPESGLYTPNFFGCSADEFHIDAVLEWVQYKKEWEKREAEDPAQNGSRRSTTTSSGTHFERLGLTFLTLQLGGAIGRHLRSRRKESLHWHELWTILSEEPCLGNRLQSNSSSNQTDLFWTTC